MKEGLKDIFNAVSSLKEKYGDKHGKTFTLDGKLVGDIGEVLVAENYNITLYKDNKHHIDGYVKEDEEKGVQIKSSFKNNFYFPKDVVNVPPYFIAINISEDGGFKEIYNGRSQLIYDELVSHRSKESKSPYKLSANQLVKLNGSEKNIDRIKRVK